MTSAASMNAGAPLHACLHTRHRAPEGDYYENSRAPRSNIAIGKNAIGGQLVAIAATDNLAPWILVVRSTLRGKIKRPADLAGRVIGVHSSSLSTKTASQQVAELALSKNGIAPDSVRFISTGQSWESISAALRNGSADAVMIEEPFATRAEQEGLGYAIFNSLMQDKAPSIPGAKFLRGALLAERRKVTVQPGLAAQAVRMIKRSLIWIHSHGSEELVNLLDLKGREREAFLAAMQRYRAHYSTDGKFSSVQLQETARIFRALNPSSSAMTLHPAEDMIIDTWSGRKP